MKAKIGLAMIVMPVTGFFFWALMQLPWLHAVGVLCIVLWVLLAYWLMCTD